MNYGKLIVGFMVVSALSSTAWAQSAEGDSADLLASAGQAADNVRGMAADESIYVVQRRAYSKSGKFELSPVFFTAVNPKFVGYFGGAISAAYHFQENFALEFTTSLFALGYWSDLVFELNTYLAVPLQPDLVDLKQVDYFNALSLQFSALYGKLEFYGHLVDYDFYVFGGLGYSHTLEQCEPEANSTTCSPVDDFPGKGLQVPARGMDEHKISAHLGGGMRVFFHEMFGVKLEVRNISHSDRVEAIGETTTDIRSTMLLMMAASFIL